MKFMTFLNSETLTTFLKFNRLTDVDSQLLTFTTKHHTINKVNMNKIKEEKLIWNNYLLLLHIIFLLKVEFKKVGICF
jgi:hypothetical protein